MTKRKVIFEEKSENYTRYYCNLLGPTDKKALLVLRQKRLREIVLLILIKKKAKSQLITRTLKLSPSTVSCYLKYLVENSILEKTRIGYENIYTLKDEDRIAKILVAYKRSFLDEMVDKWMSTWIEKHFVKVKSDEEKPE
jgi:predicted transcriptional regulator